MGIYNNGPFSGFSGRVGNLVSASWRDRDVLKTRPKYKRNRATSEAQAEQREKFNLASKLTAHLTQLIKTSYGKKQKAKATNIAYQAILQDVISGQSPNFQIDYSKLPVALGPLKGAVNPVATSTAAGKISFAWMDNTLSQQAIAADTSILVVFCEEMQEIMYQLNGATRSMEADEIDASFFSGKQVHTWISFLSPDKTIAANSKYTGMVTVL